MITPTIGRVVWVFRPFVTNDVLQAEAAFVVYVWNDRLINVAGFDHDGNPFALTSLPLVQDDEPKPEGNFAAWMPYQKGQAAKQDAAAAADMVVRPADPVPVDPVPPAPGADNRSDEQRAHDATRPYRQ